MQSIEERIANLEYYQELGRAVVGQAIVDYIKYLKVSRVHCNDKFKNPEAYAIGKQAKRFLESKESNLLGGISMDMNIREAVDTTYSSNKYTIDNVYYRETKRRRGNDNERSNKQYRID